MIEVTPSDVVAGRNTKPALAPANSRMDVQPTDPVEQVKIVESPKITDLELSTTGEVVVEIRNKRPVIVGAAHDRENNTLRAHKVFTASMPEGIVPDGIFFKPSRGTENYNKVSRASLLVVANGPDGFVCNTGKSNVILLYDGPGGEVYRRTLLGSESIQAIKTARAAAKQSDESSQPDLTDDELVTRTSGKLYRQDCTSSRIVLPAMGSGQTPVIRSDDRDRGVGEYGLHFSSRDPKTVPPEYYGDPSTFKSYYEQVIAMDATDID